MLWSQFYNGFQTELFLKHIKHALPKVIFPAKFYIIKNKMKIFICYYGIQI